MYRDTTNVEPEMYDCTSNNWSHWNSNEKLKEKFGNCTRKTFDRFTTKDSYTWNITHNTESTAVWSLKCEQWGSPLVQEKYREEKACDKRHPYRIIIIKGFALFLCQHKDSLGLVHCNSNLTAVLQGDVCDTPVLRKDKHWLLVTLAFVQLV